MNFCNRLQLFHLIQHDGTGGESLYVDAFECAEKLRKINPKSYSILSNTPIPYHSAGDANISIFPSPREYPILNHDRRGELYQVRFNNDDRSVLNNLNGDQVEDFYKALKDWTNILRDPKNEFWIKLKPGLAVIMDNWRVLHGRASFTGQRRMVGCYINRDDYKSRVRAILNQRVNF